LVEWQPQISQISATDFEENQSLKMQEQRRKFPLHSWEVVLLAILTPIIYVGGYVILYDSIIKIFVLERMPIFLSFFIILAFDVGWVIMMKKLPLKNIKVKIIVTWPILVLSASVLTYLFVMWVLEGALV
jgi:hypothetical protein